MAPLYGSLNRSRQYLVLMKCLFSVDQQKHLIRVANISRRYLPGRWFLFYSAVPPPNWTDRFSTI
jgi:hypothetical protein